MLLFGHRGTRAGRTTLDLGPPDVATCGVTTQSDVTGPGAAAAVIPSVSSPVA